MFCYFYRLKYERVIKNKVSIFAFTVLLALAANLSVGQERRLLNLANFDKKTVHFGFSLGLNTASFIIDKDLTKSDTLVSLEAISQSGFNLGIVSDLHLGPYFDLRFIPALSFGERRLEYTLLNSAGERSVLSKPVESTYLDFPLNLKYRSQRDGNFAAYIVGGAMYSYDLISQADDINPTGNLADMIVKLQKHNYHFQLGVGFDFFMEYFKFSPEIKMSYGLTNAHVNDGTILSTPITNLQSKILLVSFTFEG